MPLEIKLPLFVCLPPLCSTTKNLRLGRGKYEVKNVRQPRQSAAHLKIGEPADGA